MSSELPPAIEPGPLPVYPTSTGDVNALAARVDALESRLSPNSWLYSTNFLKRAFALYGHILVAGLIVGIIVWGVFFVCFVLFGFSMAGLSNR